MFDILKRDDVEFMEVNTIDDSYFNALVITDTRDKIKECSKKYFGIQNKDLNNPDFFKGYEYIGESEIVSCDKIIGNTNIIFGSKAIKFSEPKQYHYCGKYDDDINEEDCKYSRCAIIFDPIEYEYYPKFSIKNPGNGTLIAREFAINVKSELIDSIEIIIGVQRVERIFGDMFEVLYDMYDLPETNEEGYTIIPFYLSKFGIEKLKYHETKVIVKFKKAPQEYELKIKLQHSIVTNPKNILLHQIQKHEFGNRLCINHPVSHFIVNGDLEALDLSFNGQDNIIIKRCKKYETCSLFSFVDNLNDYDHMINFSVIDNAIIKNHNKNLIYYCINIQILRSMNGMAGLKYSK